MNKDLLKLLKEKNPYYWTRLGVAFLGDSREELSKIPTGSVNLIVTSPPYALKRKKEYGNPPAEEYIDWFLGFVPEIKRVLASDGSFVLNIGGSWTKSKPTRDLYHFEILLTLVKDMGFKLAQEFFWYNPAKLPSPTEWVNVRRIRVKDAVEPIWWLCKNEFPKADNKRVLVPYSDSMKQLLQNGYRPGLRPSGHDITDKFQKDNLGAIPPNILQISNTDSNSRYQRLCRKYGYKRNPARFPENLPRFFIKFLTEPGDIVLDPFAGSNTTGWAAQEEGRKWISIERDEGYLKASQLRFDRVYPRLTAVPGLQTTLSEEVSNGT